MGGKSISRDSFLLLQQLFDFLYRYGAIISMREKIEQTRDRNNSNMAPAKRRKIDVQGRPFFANFTNPIV